MVTVLAVLKSGGIYTPEWVGKLHRGVARHLIQPHRFACISDVEVPCERIVPDVDWPGWWLKIFMFKPGIINGPTIYMDLDTVITGSLDELVDQPYSFAMLRNFQDATMVGSGVMWFKEKAPEGVYERFLQDPKRIMDFYENAKHGSYMGDQAFLYDFLNREIETLHSPALRSYKVHCRNGLPEGTSIVCFHGRPRPTEINPEWMQRNWI